MAFRSNKKDWDYEVVREGEENILYVYAESLSSIPSIEDSSVCMAHTIDILNQVGDITKIIFTQKRDYEYNYNQTQMLYEIARIYKKIIRQKNLFAYRHEGLPPTEITILNQRYAEVQNLVFKFMKQDPVGAYVQLKRALRRERIALERSIHPRAVIAT